MEKDAKTGIGKPRWHILPWDSINEVLKVMEFGNKKYPVDSWKKMDNDSDQRYFSALMRHMYAWRTGELIDPESGLPHLAHAACNVLFLLGFHIMRDKK